MNENPLTVITVCFNSADTLDDTLKSVSDQRGVVPLHLIQDGGSCDATKNVVEKYNNIRFTSDTDKGIYDALNKAILSAPDGIIGLLHADDFYPDQDVLHRVMQYFNDNPDKVGVYGDLKYVSSRDPLRIVRNWRSCGYRKGMLRRGWMPPHPTLFLRRSVYADLGGFNLDYRISSDYDFILRVFEKYGDRIGYIPSVLVHMRTGGVSNASFTNILLKMAEDLRIASKFGVYAPFVLAMKNLSKLMQVRIGW